MTDRFVYISQINPLMIAPAILLIAIILFAVGLIADKTREMIFKIVRVKELMVKLDALLESGFNKLIVKFSGSLM